MRLPFANYVKAHHISRAALTVGVVVAAILFFVVGAGLRLLMGPVSLGPLRGTIAEAIRQALPGITLQYDQAAIEWSRDQGRVNLVILGARMFDSGGRIVAQAPKADIDLAARPFLSGHFVVRRITLVGVQLALVHMKAGGIRLGVEKDVGGEDIIAKLSDVINANGSNTSSLESFAVRDARLAVYDEPTGLFIIAPRASLRIHAKGAAIGADFDADVEVSGRGAHMTADLTLPPHSGPIRGNLKVTGLDLRALSANAPMFASLKDIALTANLSTRFSFAPGGRLGTADFDLSANGEMPIGLVQHRVLHVRNVHLLGGYDGAARRVSLASADLDAREMRGRLMGQGTLSYDAQGALAAIDGNLAATRLTIDLPGFFAHAVGFQALNFSGSYHVAEHRLDIARVTLAAPALALEANGAVTFAENQSPGLVLSGKIAALPVRTLLNYWPLPVVVGARDWIDANVFAGFVGPAQFQTNFAPGVMDQAALPNDALKLTFGLRGIEASYLAGLTHLTGVNGNAVLGGDDFTADFGGAHVGNLAVRGGRAIIPALHNHGTVGTFSAHVDGPMPDIMTLIDMKPLGYPTRFGIDPKQTKGDASVDLLFHVPMLENLPVDDIGISVKGAVSDFAIALGHLHLSDGAVNFDIDNDRLHQSGTAIIADQRFTFDWTEDFKTSEQVTTRIAAKGILSENVRAALNIGLGRIVSGAMPVSAVITGHRGALTMADANIDLTPATITVPILNLGKPSGEAASGHVIVNFMPGDIVSDQIIHITGATMSASGTATFDKEGTLAKLDFPSVKMGTLNDLGFTLTRGAAGDDYALRGHSLDGSGIGRNGSSDAPNGGAVPKSGDDTPQGPFHISAHLDRFAMRDGVAIAPFNLDLSGVGNRPGPLTLSGNLSKSATINAVLEAAPQGRKLTLSAADAGLLTKGLFAFEGIRGGALTISATLPGRASDPDIAGPAPDFQGTLAIANFKVVNQPMLARLFAAGSLTGMGDLMQGDGISVEKFEMPFTSKNNVISVNGARVTGRAIGATADGYIDRPKDQIALKGSLVPAYGLNSMLGILPVVGNLLVSKKGEGVFGVTYSLTGKADQPSLSVNPLSMITPGILRRIFEGHIPNAANAPSNAPGAQPAAPTGPQAAQAVTPPPPN